MESHLNRAMGMYIVRVEVWKCRGRHKVVRLCQIMLDRTTHPRRQCNVETLTLSNSRWTRSQHSGHLQAHVLKHF